MKDGLLVLDKGQQVRLSGGDNNHYQGAIEVDHDGAYHVAGLDQGQAVRLSEDFFIEARKAWRANGDASPGQAAITARARSKR